MKGSRALERPHGLSVGERLGAGARALALAAALSGVGAALEGLAAYLSGSMVLYTDFVHWLADGLLEAFAALSLFAASRRRARYEWLSLVLEGIVALLLVSAVFAFYAYSLYGYLGSFIEGSAEPTTRNPRLALVVAAGGAANAGILYVERRAYERARLVSLKADLSHALVDFGATAAAAAGVLASSLSGDARAELASVLLVFVFALHGCTYLVSDVAVAMRGGRRSAELELKLLRELRSSGLPEPERVEVRQVGSFYVATVAFRLSPRATLLELHRLRRAVESACGRVSELVYHVDVLFLPRWRPGGRRPRRASQ